MGLPYMVADFFCEPLLLEKMLFCRNNQNLLNKMVFYTSFCFFLPFGKKNLAINQKAFTFVRK
jgi:hypothetical protein